MRKGQNCNTEERKPILLGRRYVFSTADCNIILCKALKYSLADKMLWACSSLSSTKYGNVIDLYRTGYSHGYIIKRLR